MKYVPTFLLLEDLPCDSGEELPELELLTRGGGGGGMPLWWETWEAEEASSVEAFLRRLRGALPVSGTVVVEEVTGRGTTVAFGSLFFPPFALEWNPASQFLL